MRSGKSLLVCIFLSASLSLFAQTSDSGLPKLNHFDASQADKSIDPCVDFYKFMCSKWKAANPIPPDQAIWSTSSNLEIWNEGILRDTMQEASTAKNRDAVHQKIGDYWAACMNEAAINRDGLKPVQPMLDRINAMKSVSELPAVIAEFHKSAPSAWEGGPTQTRTALFGYGQQQDYKDATLVVGSFDQAGLGMPSRDFYLSDNPKLADTRAKYIEHLKKTFELAGESPEQATKDEVAVMEIEAALAKVQMDAVSRRDPEKIYHVYSLDQFKQLSPSFDWAAYLKNVESPTPKFYIVSTPEFFKALEPLLKSEPLDAWKAYLRSWTLYVNSRYLSQPFVDENFNFYGRVLNGAEQNLPRWRRCVAYADRDLGEALGEAYVEKAFPPSSKERTDELVRNVEFALAGEIKNLDWMSPPTKKEALAKLDAIENKIGYPKKWRDYSSVKIVPDNMIANVQQATAFEFKRQLDKIGKPVDRQEWQMTPPTINAYYDPQLNTINFPAGILQPPFFDPSQTDAVNYGAVGMVIGHEISHGFDDQGRKFDAQGNLRDWWTPEDAKLYEQKVACFVNEYTREVPELGVKTNGKLTLGEDSADNAGLRIALQALSADYKQKGKSLDDKDPDGWTSRQKFFMSHAFNWCDNIRPELARTQITTDPHSLGEFRVNNVEKNFPEFWQAFGCKKGQPMVADPECRVW